MVLKKNVKHRKFGVGIGSFKHSHRPMDEPAQPSRWFQPPSIHEDVKQPLHPKWRVVPTKMKGWRCAFYMCMYVCIYIYISPKNGNGSKKTSTRKKLPRSHWIQNSQQLQNSGLNTWLMTCCFSQVGGTKLWYKSCTIWYRFGLIIPLIYIIRWWSGGLSCHWRYRNEARALSTIRSKGSKTDRQSSAT